MLKMVKCSWKSKNVEEIQHWKGIGSNGDYAALYCSKGAFDSKGRIECSLNEVEQRALRFLQLES